jgi:hypothetical protein
MQRPHVAHPHILVPHRHGAALDDVTNVHKNSGIFQSDDQYLQCGRITREAYDEVRRLTVPRFVVLWEEGEPLPPPGVALVCRSCLGAGFTGGGVGVGWLCGLRRMALHFMDCGNV